MIGWLVSKELDRWCREDTNGNLGIYLPRYITIWGHKFSKRVANTLAIAMEDAWHDTPYNKAAEHMRQAWKEDVG